jgi:hypothetical protein
MISALRAIVWLRWRLLVNAVKGSRRRDAVEQFSRMLGTMVPFMFLALSLGTIVAVAVIGFLGGRAIATGLLEADIGVFIARIALIVILALLLIITVVSPTQTALTKYGRLLLLPIPRQALHVIEVIANLLDPWVGGFLIPGLLLFAAGFAVGGKPMTGLMALVAGLAIMAVVAATGAFISFLIGWLLRSRKRGEMFTLVFVLLVSLFSFVPAALSHRLDSRDRDRSGPRPKRVNMNVADFDRSLPAWTRAVPSELYGRAIVASVQGRTGESLFALGVLVAEAVVLFVLSSATHRKLIESLESDTRRRKKAAARQDTWRLPLAGPAVSAIAITEFRSAVRSVRGRLAVLLPGPMMGFLMLMTRRVPDEASWLTNISQQGYLILATGLVFALYALQPFSMNVFGTDRSGLTRLFLVPASDVELARGKIAGCGLVFAAAGALCLIVALVVAPNGAISYWIATILGGASTFALLSPIAILGSTFFPVAADMSKTGSGGNPHPFPMLAGTVIVPCLAMPAAGIFLVNWLWIRQPPAVLMLMIVWLAVALVISVQLLGLASRTIATRRDNLATIAQGR